MATIVRAPEESKLALIVPYARLAAYAYEPPGTTAPVPPGFAPLDKQPLSASEATGFLARSFRVTGREDVLIVAFAGTSPTHLGSLLTDVALVAGKVPEQFTQAEAYVRSVRDRYPGREIVVVGHSLGGALAIFVAQKLGGINAIAYNAPFLSDALWRQIPGANRQSFANGPWYINLQSSGDRLTAFRIGRDPVSSVQLWKQAAVEVIRLKTGCEADALCHSVEQFLPTTPVSK